MYRASNSTNPGKKPTEFGTNAMHAPHSLHYVEVLFGVYPSHAIIYNLHKTFIRRMVGGGGGQALLKL